MECIMSAHKKYSLLGLLFLGLLFSFCVTVSAETVWVDDDYHYPAESDGTLSKPYATIQAAINAAQNGDVIKILPGTYHEDLIIDKSVSLRTDSIEETTITTNNKQAYLVDVQASDVSIERFTLLDETNTSHRKAVFHIARGVQDVVISENYIPSTIISRGLLATEAEGIVVRDNVFNNTDGIQLENCLSCSIANNIIKNNNVSTGIRIINSIGSVIAENTIQFAMHGIHILSSKDTNITNNIIQDHISNGVYIQNGDSHQIKDNTIKNNGLNGIKLTGTDSTVKFNEISSNLNGITIEDDRNVIYNNTITNNPMYGLLTGSMSDNNTIYENRFISTQDNPLAIEEGNNYWSSNGIGNYWSDYLGPDNDENNLGDIPYTINNVNDEYPTGKFHTYPTLSNPSPGHLAEEVDLHPTLSVTVQDKEDERLDVSFYYILENESHLIETVKNVESGKKASVAFYSTVKGQNAVYTYLGAGYDYIGVWYVTVSDTYSTTTSDSWIFSTMHVPVDNDPPTSMISCSTTAETHDPITFDASNCFDPDGTISFYRWSFGDGSNIINDKNPTHSYEEPGTYNVSLVVIDNNGSSASSTTQVTVATQQNDPPNAQVNGPYFAKANTFIAFSSTGSNDPDLNDELSFEWSFGNGETSPEQNPTYKYKNGGNYSVTLTVTDSAGVSDSSSTYALITQPKEQSTPGFDFIILLFAGLIMFIYISQKSKKKVK